MYQCQVLLHCIKLMRISQPTILQHFKSGLALGYLESSHKFGYTLIPVISDILTFVGLQGFGQGVGIPARIGLSPYCCCDDFG